MAIGSALAELLVQPGTQYQHQEAKVSLSTETRATYREPRAQLLVRVVTITAIDPRASKIADAVSPNAISAEQRTLRRNRLDRSNLRAYAVNIALERAKDRPDFNDED